MSMYIVTVTLRDGRKLSGVIMALSEYDATRQCLRAGGVVVADVEAVRSY